MGLKDVMNPESGSIHSEKDVMKDGPVVGSDAVRDDRTSENEKAKDQE